MNQAKFLEKVMNMSSEELVEQAKTVGLDHSDFNNENTLRGAVLEKSVSFLEKPTLKTTSLGEPQSNSLDHTTIPMTIGLRAHGEGSDTLQKLRDINNVLLNQATRESRRMTFHGPRGFYHKNVLWCDIQPTTLDYILNNEMYSLYPKNRPELAELRQAQETVIDKLQTKPEDFNVSLIRNRIGKDQWFTQLHVSPRSFRYQAPSV